jgi:hypothetical protein
VASAPDGDAYVMASTESFGAEKSDLWVLRIDEQGEVAWDRRVEHDTWTAFPYGERLQDGSLVAAIRTERSMDKSYDEDQNISVVRLTPDGDIAWRTLVSGPGSPAGKDEVFDVVPAHGDGVVMVGTSNTGHESWHPDFWAAKVGSNGDLDWQRQYDSDQQDLASSVVRTEDGYVLAGGSQNDTESTVGMVLAIDADGNEQYRLVGEHVEETEQQFASAGWPEGGPFLLGGSILNREEVRSSAFMAVHMDVSKRETRGPSAWETQHGSTDGDGTDGDDSGTGGDGGSDGNDAGGNDGDGDGPGGTPTFAPVEGSGPMGLALYGGAAGATFALFLPYLVRRYGGAIR